MTRILGTVVHPRNTLRNVLAVPTWADTAAVLALVTALAGGALMGTEVGRLALLDQWERTGLAFGATIDDAQYAVLRAWSERAAPVYAVGSALVRGPVLSFIIAAALYLTYRTSARGSGGASERPPFTTILAVVVHASVVLALRDLLEALSTYIRESATSFGSLGLWLPSLDSAAPIARLLGAVDLLVVWWLVVLAIGVGLLYRRPARRLAFTFVGLYLGVALVLTAATTVLDTGV